LPENVVGIGEESPIFRGRRREFLSESRMREIRPSGSMSGE
jgi:hypothetical protein